MKCSLLLRFVILVILSAATFSGDYTFPPDVSLTGGQTADDSLLLRCHGSYLFSVYWKRNDTFVAVTRNFWRDTIQLNEISRAATSWRNHYLKIRDNLEVNLASYWSCADNEDGPFTDPLCFKSSFSGSTLPPIPSGNLTLDVHPDVQLEGHLMTLTCTVDTLVGYWETMWIRNGYPVLFTNSNSTLIGQENFTLANETFYFENVTVSADERQQNVTFLVTREIVDNSNWSCKFDGISEQSNVLNFTEGAVISKVKTIRLPPSSVDDNGLPLYIGSALGGVVLVALIIIIAVIIRKRHRNHHSTDQIWTSQNSGLHPQRNLSLVTRENSLYESTTDGLLEAKPESDNAVMVDNILYSSSFTEDTEQSQLYLTAV